MKYYRVPAALDGRQCYKPGTGSRIPNGYTLIRNELLTAGDVKRNNAPINALEPVEIKKTRVYRLFGARFEFETNYNGVIK